MLTFSEQVGLGTPAAQAQDLYRASGGTPLILSGYETANVGTASKIGLYLDGYARLDIGQVGRLENMPPQQDGMQSGWVAGYSELTVGTVITDMDVTFAGHSISTIQTVNGNIKLSATGESTVSIDYVGGSANFGKIDGNSSVTIEDIHGRKVTATIEGLGVLKITSCPKAEVTLSIIGDGKAFIAGRIYQSGNHTIPPQSR